VANNRDAILLETVKTHRARLLAAFLFGEMSERRVANDNLKRLIGSVVLAAVVCAGCVGFSLVSSLLAGQAAAKQQQAGEGPPTQPPYVSETFDRTQTAGWGQADLGGAWTLFSDPAAYAVGNGAGTINLTGGQTGGGYLAANLQDSTDLLVSFVAPDASARITVFGRRVSSTQDYRAVIQLTATGQVSVSLAKKELVGPFEPITETVTLLGNPTPGDPMTVRMQVRGTNPTVIRAKVWWGAGAEPPTWTVAANDSSAGLQRPGSIGLAVGATGEDVTFSVLDLVARPANS
jgi:hypothetical protein